MNQSIRSPADRRSCTSEGRGRGQLRVTLHWAAPTLVRGGVLLWARALKCWDTHTSGHFPCPGDRGWLCGATRVTQPGHRAPRGGAACLAAQTRRRLGRGLIHLPVTARPSSSPYRRHCYNQKTGDSKETPPSDGEDTGETGASGKDPCPTARPLDAGVTLTVCFSFILGLGNSREHGQGDTRVD